MLLSHSLEASKLPRTPDGIRADSYIKHESPGDRGAGTASRRHRHREPTCRLPHASMGSETRETRARVPRRAGRAWRRRAPPGAGMGNRCLPGGVPKARLPSIRGASWHAAPPGPRVTPSKGLTGSQRTDSVVPARFAAPPLTPYRPRHSYVGPRRRTRSPALRRGRRATGTQGGRPTGRSVREKEAPDGMSPPGAGASTTPYLASPTEVRAGACALGSFQWWRSAPALGRGVQRPVAGRPCAPAAWPSDGQRTGLHGSASRPASQGRTRPPPRSGITRRLPGRMR